MRRLCRSLSLPFCCACRTARLASSHVPFRPVVLVHSPLHVVRGPILGFGPVPIPDYGVSCICASSAAIAFSFSSSARTLAVAPSRQRSGPALSCLVYASVPALWWPRMFPLSLGLCCFWSSLAVSLCPPSLTPVLLRSPAPAT